MRGSGIPTMVQQVDEGQDECPHHQELAHAEREVPTTPRHRLLPPAVCRLRFPARGRTRPSSWPQRLNGEEGASMGGYSILTIIGAVVVVIVILKLLGLF